MVQRINISVPHKKHLTQYNKYVIMSIPNKKERYNKMKKDYQCIDGMYVTRRTKAKARKDYNEGYTVYIVPSNMAFRSMWYSPSRINKTYNDCENRTFDSICNEIEFYQCNTETGKYLRFYTMSDSERKNELATL